MDYMLEKEVYAASINLEMGMGDIGDNIIKMFAAMSGCLAFFVPLGIWKLCELIMQAYEFLK